MAAIETWKLMPPGAADDAVPIGARPNQRPEKVLAMRVAQAQPRAGGSRAFCFVEEVALEESLQWREAPTWDGRTHAWNRIEFKYPSGPNGKIHKRDVLILVQHPYAAEWCEDRPFKPPSKKGPVHSPARTDSATVEEHAKWLDALTHDYWESRDFLTAGLLWPLGSAAPAHEIARVYHAGLTVVGVVAEYESVLRELLQAPEVLRLLSETESNRIVFAHPDAQAAGAVKLYDEVIDERVSLMYCSIRQALAGPYEESDAWFGRPVTRLVDFIYREHLNRLNRRVARRREFQLQEGPPSSQRGTDLDG